MTEAIDNTDFINKFLHETKLIKLLREGCKKPDGQIDHELFQRFGLDDSSFGELFKVVEPVFRFHNLLI